MKMKLTLVVTVFALLWVQTAKAQAPDVSKDGVCVGDCRTEPPPQDNGNVRNVPNNTSPSSTPLHTHRNPNGTISPDDGYTWATNDPNNNNVVRIVAGAAHPFYPNVVWSGEGESFHPAFGYVWEGDVPRNTGFRVRLDNRLTRGFDGKLHPRNGFHWCNDLPNDDSICTVAGAAHPFYPNVVWSDEGESFRPASGYIWENGDNPGSAGFRVVPAYGLITDIDGRLHPRTGFRWCNQIPGDYSVCGVAGAAHPEYPNVVWTGEGQMFRPASGHMWENPADPRSAGWRVVSSAHLTPNPNGGMKPLPGYQWKYPNNPNNFEVYLLPGLQTRADGKVLPLEGFRWAHPEIPGNTAIVPVPPAQRTQAALQNIREFVGICKRLLSSPDTSNEQLKLHCGNVQFDGADPNLPPLKDIKKPFVIRENK